MILYLSEPEPDRAPDVILYVLGGVLLLIGVLAAVAVLS